MKRSLALVLTLASGLALSAAAQMPAAPVASAPPTAAPATPAKIAVIAWQLAVAQTNEGQRDFADLQKKYAPKEAALKSLSDEIDKLTKDLQDQGATLSDIDRANRAKSIDDKKKQLDRETEDLRNDGQQDMQDLFSGLQAKVYDVMQSYAEQQGFTLILDISQQQSPVLYASNGTNITKQVIDAYNLKSGVPAPAAQPAAEAPRPRPTTPRPNPLPQRQSPQGPTDDCCGLQSKAPLLGAFRSLRSPVIPVEIFVDFSRKPSGKGLKLPSCQAEFPSGARSNLCF